MGKLGHSPEQLSEQAKRRVTDLNKGYRPKNYADFNQMDYVYGDLSDKTVINAACGFQHTACVTDQGDVYTWGNGKSGALGHGDWS